MGALQVTADVKPKHQPTVVLSTPAAVAARLKELNLDRTKLLTVAAIATAEKANATPYHCANAGGTFAYQHGTFALRDKFAEDGWVPDRVDGVESIRFGNIKVAFSNVDVACDSLNLPRPRTDKGAGAERAANISLFDGDSLPHFGRTPTVGPALYYLMVGEDGRAELTRAAVQNGVFVAAIERIFLGRLEDDMDAPSPPIAADVADGFDPVVERKRPFDRDR